MLKQFRIANFQINVNKCEFFIIEIKYLKLIISINKIKLISTKRKIMIH